MARKPKQPAVTSADILKAMYPDLPTSEDYVDPLKAAAAEQQTQKPQDNAQMAELQRQVAALQGQLTQQSRTSTVLMQQAQTDMPPVRPQIDVSKAPDPITDAAGYAQFIINANAANVQYEKDLYAWQARQQNDVANKTSALWDGFAGKYAELAKDPQRVKIATAEVLDRAKLAGRDVDKYMYGASDQFMDDVAAEMGKLWPTAKGADNDDDEDDFEDGATDMLGGGAGGQSAASTKGRQAPPERYGALSNEVLAWQKATGFHG